MIYPGTWLVLATLAIVLTLFVLGYLWARAQGQFDDVEAAKYAMLRSDSEADWRRDDDRGQAG
jgi:cbb3-type cytochrome oxidase maturation protein